MLAQTMLCSVAPSLDVYTDGMSSTCSKRLSKHTVEDIAEASSGNLSSGFAKEDLPNFTLPPWSVLLQSGWGVALVLEHCCNFSIANGNTFTLSMSAGRPNLCGLPPAIVFMLYEGMVRALPCAWMTLHHIVLENATYISYLLSTLDTALYPYLSPNTLRLSENMTSVITASSAATNTQTCRSHTLEHAPALVPQTRGS